MHRIPTSSNEFLSLVRTLLPGDGADGASVREFRFPGSPQVTVAFVSDLIPPDDLQALVLQPLTAGGITQPPREVARSGRFPAALMKVVERERTMQKGLLAGLAALHVDGYDQVLLMGSGRANHPQETFVTDVGANRAILRRMLRTPDLRFKAVRGKHGARAIVAYLNGVASGQTVEAMVQWAEQLSTLPPRMPWWSALKQMLRIPPVVEIPSPAATVEALRHGYVAVLSDHLPSAQVGPTNLELMVAGPHDVTLSPPIRRLVTWPRFLLAAFAMWAGGILTAVTSYHHAMMPGPFLVTLATSRQANPLPIFLEIMVMEVLDNILWAIALRVGGRRWTIMAALGTLLAGLLGYQTGIISPVSALVAAGGSVGLQVLPSIDLVQRVRFWRPLVTVTAAALGMYGLSLLLYALLIYLGEERHFGRYVRERREVKSS